jgi:tryptophan-rich sensory protein
MKKFSYGKLIVAIAIPQIAGGIGAIFTTPKIQTWYSGLHKPFFSPPNWVFGPVWSALFLLMGISLFLVWKKKKLGDKVFNSFWIQLGLNVLWSIIFFGLENPGLALLEIILLWIFIKKNINSFYKVNKKASALLYPYLAWVSFASLLNAAVWWINR